MAEETSVSGICVVGAGRMGSIYGGLLAMRGVQVTFFDSWRQHIEAIRRDGLLLSLLCHLGYVGWVADHTDLQEKV